MTTNPFPTKLQSIAAEIRLVVFDVDGILTDGRLYYGADGESLKVFNVKDGHGLKQLQKCGVELAVISGRGGAAVQRRLDDLGITEVQLNAGEKLPLLHALADRLSIPLSQCAFMGDDEPDLPAMNAAGLALTVADAAAPVRSAADWVSQFGGGRGGVREACDQLIAARRS